MKKKKNLPRNSHALIAKMKPLQIFHHKCEERDKNTNQQKEFMEEYIETRDIEDGYFFV